MKALFWRGILLFLILFTGCKNVTREEIDFTFIEVDVTKNYPVKELFLDDLAEIEYCIPAVHDDYLYRGIPRFVTDDHMLIFEHSSGTVLVFDKNGTPLYNFNKKGDGPHEYNLVFSLIYDPHIDELYIQTVNYIKVYSLKGDYKRTISLEGEGRFVSDLVIFDDETFICYDNYEYFPVPFFLMSRADGHLIEEIDIRYENKLKMSVSKSGEDGVYTYSPMQSNIVKTPRGFLLTDHSIDSVYLYTPDRQLIPVLARTPAIASMNPYIYLNSYVDSPSYLFMNTVSTEFDWDTKRGFSETHLVLDKSDGKLYNQKIYLKDYQGKEITLSPSTQERVSGNRNGMISFNVAELQDALEDGKLSGRLKEIVSGMDEESNRLLLFFRFR
ncbi:MAG: 6-bladed beta-propeller [Tannerellaceae bacterium]|nr:6-bladed beta-propeller [Tannerellaceae bacterium]